MEKCQWVVLERFKRWEFSWIAGEEVWRVANHKSIHWLAFRQGFGVWRVSGTLIEDPDEIESLERGRASKMQL